ncbi:ATP-binding protein [Lentzea atacamensis]|uniref:ATP-binding protein n=1 Tax=Lentzea atacamensis TaxID=531938 RepID=UPI001C01E1BD|nr:LuxR C-terminal-related transcriptional regulator [Lentzea atacamensis]
MARRAGVLPAEVSSFVDRHRERGRIKQLLTEARLVTVAGIGGVGKTRTALRVATELRRSFPDGVWWVELSALRDPELLAYVVAEALGIGDATLRPMDEVLAGFLGGKQLLLVLDTCEHLAEACAALVDGLLRAAPGFRVLATSRQPLKVPGERLFTVSPLAGTGLSDGVELFVERSRAISGIVLSDEEYRVVARLCQRVDGIPLAIELAAARTRALPVQYVLDHLDDRFRMLGAMRAGVARHQTMRAAINWSYELCSPSEQLLWARLSVFVGAFDLTAVAEVCADDRLPPAELPALVTALADKSILLHEDRSGESRYRLLDTIRAYGRDRLGTEEDRTEYLRRHRDHYLRLAQRFDAEWCGPHQARWRDRLTDEHANLRAALDFCLRNPAERHQGLELAGALRYYWIACGALREGRHYLDRLLDCDLAPDPTLWTAQWVCAWLAVANGELAAVDTLLARCRPEVERHGDVEAAGWIAYVAGAAAMARGDLSAAVELGERSATLHQQGGDTGTGLFNAWCLLAMAFALAGDAARAIAVCDEGRAACDARGERWARSHLDYMSALAELTRGDFDAAAAYARDALRFKRLLGDNLGFAVNLDALASATAAQGQADRAARLLGIAHQVWQTFGLPQFGSPDLRAARQLCERQARAVLGDAAYRAAFDAGLELDLDSALRYALDEQPPKPPQTAEQPLSWAPLTRRERQIAELVADGLANKQIAEQLVISTRTAEGHVERILVKLGLDNRSQIAAWATRRRKPKPPTEPNHGS